MRFYNASIVRWIDGVIPHKGLKHEDKKENNTEGR